MMISSNFQWRSRAKFASFLDVTLSVVSLIVVIVYAIIQALALTVIKIVTDVHRDISKGKGNGGDGTEAATEETEKTPKTNSNNNIDATVSTVDALSVWILWIGVAVTCVVTLLHIWAGLKLTKSTDLKKPAHAALGAARFYLCATFILVLITLLINIIIFALYVVSVLVLLLRIGIFAVAILYTHELRVVINTQTISRVAPLN